MANRGVSHRQVRDMFHHDDIVDCSYCYMPFLRKAIDCEDNEITFGYSCSDAHCEASWCPGCIDRIADSVECKTYVIQQYQDTRQRHDVWGYLRLACPVHVGGLYLPFNMRVEIQELLVHVLLDIQDSDYQSIARAIRMEAVTGSENLTTNLEEFAVRRIVNRLKIPFPMNEMEVKVNGTHSDDEINEGGEARIEEASVNSQESDSSSYPRKRKEPPSATEEITAVDAAAEKAIVATEEELLCVFPPD
jgi:hypothetical protein